MARVLCLDDEPQVLRIVERMLVDAGHGVVLAGTAAEALHIIEREPIDLILTDFKMPGIDGIEFLSMVRRAGGKQPVIMFTAHGGVDHAVSAIRAGADDYLLKPFAREDLTHRVNRALEAVIAQRELAELRAQAAALASTRQILGNSAAIQRVMGAVATIARVRSTVLIEGESGTGKELVARALHDQSDRCRAPFVRLNCAALPAGLVESALFGHEKGAFTGAIKRVEGAFERANGGSILLDEISELALDLQAKLLRVLQEREVERVGGSGPVPVDVRVIATTNRELAQEVEKGTFRSDLYYRLNVLSIRMPPLRDRPADIPLLAQHFLIRAADDARKRVDAISPDALDLLQRRSWPGNVRELQHAIERAVVQSTSPCIDVSAFDDARPSPVASQPAAADAEPGLLTGVSLHTLNLDVAESTLIQEALSRTGNNRTKAAALLGIGVRTLRKKLNRP